MFIFDLFERDNKKDSKPKSMQGQGTSELYRATQSPEVRQVIDVARRENPAAKSDLEAIVSHVAAQTELNQRQEQELDQALDAERQLRKAYSDLHKDLADKERRFQDQEARFREFNKQVAAMGLTPPEKAAAAAQAVTDIEQGRTPSLPQKTTKATAPADTQPTVTPGVQRSEPAPGTKTEPVAKPAPVRPAPVKSQPANEPIVTRSRPPVFAADPRWQEREKEIAQRMSTGAANEPEFRQRVNRECALHELGFKVMLSEAEIIPFPGRGPGSQPEMPNQDKAIKTAIYILTLLYKGQDPQNLLPDLRNDLLNMGYRLRQDPSGLVLVYEPKNTQVHMPLQQFPKELQQFFAGRLKAVKESAWHDGRSEWHAGDNAWSSEHDQWAKESTEPANQPTYNRGGFNQLRSESDYIAKLDYLQKVLQDPSVRDMRPQINDRIDQLKKAARMAGFISENKTSKAYEQGGRDAYYHRPKKNPYEKDSDNYKDYEQGFKDSDEGPKGGKKYNEQVAVDKDRSGQPMYQAKEVYMVVHNGQEVAFYNTADMKQAYRDADDIVKKFGGEAHVKKVMRESAERSLQRAIVTRLIGSHSHLIVDYGVDAVRESIDAVTKDQTLAESQSNVSAWVRQVHKYLTTNYSKQGDQ